MQAPKSLIAPFVVLFISACVVSKDPSNTMHSRSVTPEATTFFLKLPKGGDLHTHLEGATYAENLMSYGESSEFFVNMKDGSVSESKVSDDEIPLKQVQASTDFKTKLIQHWSMEGFTGQNGHNHFFDAFRKFKPITSAYKEDMIVEILNRALLQNVSYVELMFTMPTRPKKSSLYTQNLNPSLSTQKQFSDWYQTLKSEGMFQNTDDAVSSINLLEDRLTTRMDFNPFVVTDNSPIALRFIYPVSRNQTHGFVFARLAFGFDLASRDHRVVAINLVAPEDHEIAMKEYDLHMEMCAFFKKLYPKVSITLHAGELTPELDPNKNGVSHIRDAITKGGAQRIGHGVDVLRDPNPKELAAMMVKKGTLVEVNLTSNAAILGVKGKEHPLKFYLQNKVPVALSTDDEGILRTNITKEYIRAFHEQDLSYSQMKQMIRNSLHFSFLEGSTLWSNASYEKMNSTCVPPSLEKKETLECDRFLNENPKAKLQWRLENDFLAFEKEFLK